MAKTSFIVINKDSLASLQASITSRDSDLVKSTQEQEGLRQDHVTRALAKIVSAGIKGVSANLKEFIDLELPAEDAKLKLIEKVEERMIELNCEGLKGDELKKKKTEIQTQFVKVTGKKLPESDDKKEDEEKNDKKEEDLKVDE